MSRQPGQGAPDEVAPGVWRTEHGWYYLLQGTREALLSAGLVQASWLHDGTQRDQRGRRFRTMNLIVDGHRFRTVLTDFKRQEYKVHFYRTDAEQAAHTVDQAAASAAEAQKENACQPGSADAFRRRAADDMYRCAGVIIQVASDASFDGYRLHPETIAVLRRLAGQMGKAIESGRVVIDRKAGMAAETRINARAAKSDPALQDFMLRVGAEQAVQ